MSVQATHSRYGVFLSFAGEQREIAERLRESCLLLLSECFGKEIVEEHEELLVFLDNITLEPGTRKKNLEKAVKGSNLFVALVSERFTEKEWPQKEVGWRKDCPGGTLVVPIDLPDETPLPPAFSTFQRPPYIFTPFNPNDPQDLTSLAWCVTWLLCFHSKAYSSTLSEISASRLIPTPKVHIWPVKSSAIEERWGKLMHELIPAVTELEVADTVVIFAFKIAEPDKQKIQERKQAFDTLATEQEKRMKNDLSADRSKMDRLQLEETIPIYSDPRAWYNWLKNRVDHWKLVLKTTPKRLPRFKIVPFFPEDAKESFFREFIGLSHVQMSNGSLDEGKIRKFVQDRLENGASEAGEYRQQPGSPCN